MLTQLPFVGFNAPADSGGGEITAYENTGGTGDRTSIITTTSTNISFGAGVASTLVDGNTVANALYFNSAAGDGSAYIKFDVGVGNSAVIDAFRWVQSTNASHNTWQFEGSNNDSDYDNLHSLILGGATTEEHTFTNSTPYRYYRLRHISGSRSNSPWLREIEFKIGGLV